MRRARQVSRTAVAGRLARGEPRREREEDADRGDDAVAELDERVEALLGIRSVAAARPVLAAETGAREPHERTRRDDDEHRPQGERGEPQAPRRHAVEPRLTLQWPPGASRCGSGSSRSPRRSPPSSRGRCGVTPSAGRGWGRADTAPGCSCSRSHTSRFRTGAASAAGSEDGRWRCWRERRRRPSCSSPRASATTSGARPSRLPLPLGALAAGQPTGHPSPSSSCRRFHSRSTQPEARSASCLRATGRRSAARARWPRSSAARRGSRCWEASREAGR